MERTIATTYEAPSVDLTERDFQQDAHWLFFVTFAPWSLLPWYRGLCAAQRGSFYAWPNPSAGNGRLLGNYYAGCWHW
jgi:hypothetical protein